MSGGPLGLAFCNAFNLYIIRAVQVFLSTLLYIKSKQVGAMDEAEVVGLAIKVSPVPAVLLAPLMP